jgi:ATP-dependent Lon protease
MNNKFTNIIKKIQLHNLNLYNIFQINELTYNKINDLLNNIKYKTDSILNNDYINLLYPTYIKFYETDSSLINNYNLELNSIILEIGLPTISDIYKYFIISNTNLLILNNYLLPFKVYFKENYDINDKIENIINMWNFMSKDSFAFSPELTLNSRENIIYIINKYNNKWLIIENKLLDDAFRKYPESSNSLRCDQSTDKTYFLDAAILEKKNNINYTCSQLSKSSNFYKNYIDNCNLSEILFVTKWEKYLEKLETAYIKLNNMTQDQLLYNNIDTGIRSEKISNTNFSESVYKTIKLLLLGSEEFINIASVIYNNNKDPYILNLLSHNSSSKLLKSYNRIKSGKDSKKINLKKLLVASTTMPDNIKQLVNDQIGDLKNINNDVYKQQYYIKTLINYPWVDNNDKINLLNTYFLQKISTEMNNKTFGQHKAKEAIILQMAKQISLKQNSGYVLGFNGPHGVGKTLLVKSLSDILDMPMIHIPLGGQNDGSLLCGHSYTYSNAQCGLLIKKIIEYKTTRCILYLDELDKTSFKHGDVNEISSLLIHLTDSNNKFFHDRFFDGIDFPMNNLFIIASYNDKTKIDPILLDRFTEINVNGYTINEKIVIAKDFIIPELLKQSCLKNLLLTDQQIKNIIINYTNEAGVRSLKRKIELIILKLNKLKLEANTYNNDIILSDNEIIELIDSRSKHNTKINSIDQVGVVNALYATNSGVGGIIHIQIQKNYVNKEFSFKLTGSQGDVMQESVYCAFTSAIQYLETIKPDINKIIKKDFPSGFHIHLPKCGDSGSNGPSAGITFTIAFISRILNKKVNRFVAMTGEIDLNGNILAIGGLIQKLEGAKLAGVQLVLISDENTEDINNIIKENIDLFNDNFKYIFVKNINDVIKHTFVN